MKTRGFTLVEFLIVMTLIGILVSTLSVSVQAAYRQARQAHCKSNLRQFGIASTIYRGEHNNQMPDWLSNLYPEYIDDPSIFICRSDSHRGEGSPRPAELIKIGFNGIPDDTDRPGFWDNGRNGDPLRNRAIGKCSYLYEFSAAPTQRWVSQGGEPPRMPVRNTMKSYKIAQMQYGDDSNLSRGRPVPYSASHIPIARCFHHWHDMRIYGYANPENKRNGKTTREYITLNVAYAGNVFVAPIWWEGTLRSGENRDE